MPGGCSWTPQGTEGVILACSWTHGVLRLKVCFAPNASTPRMQHLDARYHWLREQVTRAHTIRFVHCPTDLMVADALTKPLDAAKTAFFHGAFSGLRPISRPPLLGDPGRIGLSLVSPATMPLLSDV